MENLNLKEKTVEELEKMISIIRKELNSRETKKYIYKTDNYGDARNHLQKYRCWAKVIARVDTTKTNGYAFIGDFLKVDGENLVADNSLIVEHDGGVFICYRVNGDKKIKVAGGGRHTLCTFIQAVNNILQNRDG